MNKRFEIVALVGSLICILAVMLVYNFKMETWWDEYVFIQLSKNIPDYSATATWLNNMPSSVMYADIGYENYQMIYDAPIYLHMPLAPMLMWAFTHLTSDIHILRLLTIFLSIGSVFLVYLILRRHIGWYAVLSVVPVLLCAVLLSGAMWFYWDAFMVFFFLLTFYLMEAKPQSKWKYVTACCLVWTKMYVGLVLLIPLVIKNRKMLYCALSIIPFYIITVMVTGNWLYILSHYWNAMILHNTNYDLYILPKIWSIVKTWNLAPYFVLTSGILFMVRKYPSVVAFYLIALLYGLGTGFGSYQAAIMLYGGALAFPLVCHHFAKKQDVEQLVEAEV